MVSPQVALLNLIIHPLLDIEPKIDEFRIVGSTGESVGISSIKAGDGTTSTTSIHNATTAVPGLDVDTPFRISGITALDIMVSMSLMKN